MRISDWSSDVCSSDLKMCTEGATSDDLTLLAEAAVHAGLSPREIERTIQSAARAAGKQQLPEGAPTWKIPSSGPRATRSSTSTRTAQRTSRRRGTSWPSPSRGHSSRCRSAPRCRPTGSDRKSVVEGKSGSVRVDLGGHRYIKKKIYDYTSLKKKKQ